MAVVTELEIFVGVYLGIGVVVAAAYRLLWGGPFHWRHVALWPVIKGSMFWAVPPPKFARPAPRDEAAWRRRSEILSRRD